MTAPPNRQALDTSDLWRSVDRLTKDRTHRLVRSELGASKPTVEHVPIPSLWTQLVEALTSSNSSDGRPGKSTGSRSPLDLSIEALLIEMSTVLRASLTRLGHRPRVLVAEQRVLPGRPTPALVDELGHPLLDPDQAGRLAEAAARTLVRTDTSRLRHDVLSDLRQYATAVVATLDQDAIDACARQYAEWVWHAEEMLTGDDESIDVRAIRGHACPECGADHVERVEPSKDPRATDGVERFHDPALVIAFRDGQVQHVTCRACDAGWWRGDDVDELGTAIRSATNPAGQTPRPDQERPEYGDPNAGGRLAGRSDDWWPWPEPRRTA